MAKALILYNSNAFTVSGRWVYCSVCLVMLKK